MKLTPVQLKCLFTSIRPAAQEVGMEPEAYRKRILMEELGVDSFKDVSRTEGFDRLMVRIWRDRGDYARAIEYSDGNVRRLRHLAITAAAKIVGVSCADILDPSESSAVFNYIAGIAVNMHLSNLSVSDLADRLANHDGFDDFSPASLKKVIAAINAHIRRHAA